MLHFNIKNTARILLTLNNLDVIGVGNICSRYLHTHRYLRNILNKHTNKSHC